MTTNVHLTPKLERFARNCVKSGRYNNVSEVMREGLRLLEERENRRKSFAKMLEEVRVEADREGVYTIDEVTREMDEIIAKSR